MLSEQIREGGDIFFVCQVDAQPQARELVWLHNERPINETTQQFGVGRRLIISNNSLVLQQVQPSQRGKYACMASNSEGISVSNQIELRVLRK